jgi:hypothetical protein
MRINVKVKLKASQEKVVQIDQTHFEVSVHAAPVDGQANDRVVELLADYFEVPKSTVRIISGHTGRQKLVEI